MPSLFKQKNQKKSSTPKNVSHTLDTKHRQILMFFKNEEEKIPILSQEITFCKRRMKELDSHHNDNHSYELENNENNKKAYQYDDDKYEDDKSMIKEKEKEKQDIESSPIPEYLLKLNLYQLEERIQTMENEIKIIKEKKIEYLTMNASYIFDYFEHKKNISSSVQTTTTINPTKEELSLQSISSSLSFEENKKENKECNNAEPAIENKRKKQKKQINELTENYQNHCPSLTDQQEKQTKNYLINKFFKINQTSSEDVKKLNIHKRRKKNNMYESMDDTKSEINATIIENDVNDDEITFDEIDSDDNENDFDYDYENKKEIYQENMQQPQQENNLNKVLLKKSVQRYFQNVDHSLYDESKLNLSYFSLLSTKSELLNNKKIINPNTQTSVNTLCQNQSHSFDSNYFETCKMCYEGEMVSYEEEGMQICNNEECGNAVEYLVETEKPTYKEPPKEVCFYAYQRFNHWKEVLAQIQGKETTQIHKNVFRNIQKQIIKERIQKHELTHEHLKNILKKLGYSKLYEHIYYIGEKFGIKPPVMSQAFEELLNYLFIEIQRPYSEVCPDERLNFLNYFYTGHKLCELLNAQEWLKYFPLLKDREKIIEQDSIWKRICMKKGWRYIPTI